MVLFIRPGVGGNYLLVIPFQSETAVFKFLQHGVDEVLNQCNEHTTVA